MKRLHICCILIAFLVGILCPALPVSALPEDPQVLNSWNGLDANISVLGKSKLISNAEAVILYDVNSNTLVYDWNADQRMYPASLVKLLTALLAIEKGDLQETVTAQEDVLKTIPYDAVTAGIKAGETLSLQDLLYCMMVGSANDAAAVIAAHIGGTQAAFVDEMNGYAAAIGCKDSNFTNVHGLHNKDQYTTARDVAKILSVAVKNPVFMELFRTEKYTVSATNMSAERNLVTGNYLISKAEQEIYIDNRVTGGRTGVTTDQKRCLAATSQQNGMHLISVVMGCASKFAADGYTVELYGGFSETSELLDITYSDYKCAQVLFEGQILRQVPVVGAKNHVMLGSTSSLSAVLPLNATSSDLTYRYVDAQQEFKVPIEKGELLSYVEVWYGGIQVAQTQLQAMNDVKAVSFEDPVVENQNDNTWIWTVLLVIAGVVFVVLAGIAIWTRLNQGMRRAAARKRSRSYRRSRVRSR